jgi:hypothetical protein
MQRPVGTPPEPPWRDQVLGPDGRPLPLGPSIFDVLGTPPPPPPPSRRQRLWRRLVALVGRARRL